MPFGIVALPPAPSEPLVVQAAPLPRATALAPAARPQLLHRSGVLHVGPADRTAPTVAHARPIVITPITAPSAPLPAAPGQAAATPAPAPATQPAAPSPVAAAPPADRVLAATAPVAVAAPVVQQSGHERRHGHTHGNDNGKHDKQSSDDSGPAVLAPMPLDSAPLDSAPAPDPAPTDEAPLDAAPLDAAPGGHDQREHGGHGHGHGHDDGQDHTGG